MGSSPVASTNVETRLFCKESAFLRTLFAFCRFLLLPESSLSGFLFTSPFFLFGFLLRKTHKNQTSLWGLFGRLLFTDVEFCDASGAFLPRCSVAAAPVSPVASTNVETRLFCKESAFYALFAFCRFLLLPESSLSGFPLQALFACLAFCCAPI